MRSPLLALASAAAIALFACSAPEMATTAPWSAAEPHPEEGRRCLFASAAPGASLDGFERGLRLWLGDGVPKDLAAARRELEGACTAGGAAACAVLGMMYEIGEGVPADLDRARALLRESAEGDVFDFGGCEEGSPAWTSGIKGQSTACCRAARGCEEGCEAECAAGLDRVRAKTTDLVHRGCLRGERLACYLEAVADAYGLYFEGLGPLASNDGEAGKRLYDRSCQAGIGRACETMAVLTDFDVPEGPEHDARRALASSLEARACALGDGYGCYEVARHLEAGPTGSLGKAVATYERACDLGMLAVCGDLAQMYREGDGVARDPGKAARFASKAR